jgi:hypothetical protein
LIVSTDKSKTAISNEADPNDGSADGVVPGDTIPDKDAEGENDFRLVELVKVLAYSH